MTEPDRAPRVIGMWVRTASGGPMVAHAALDLVAGLGVDGDPSPGRKRHVTLLFADDWAAALADLGAHVEPSARRANVLISGSGDSGAWIGRQVRLGDALLDVVGETRPCDLMDEAAPGLQSALRPECRGGVWARVLEGGRLEAGSTLRRADRVQE